MSKITEECWCASCDSEFKIFYSPEKTSRLHSFCAFCGEVLEPVDETEVEDDDSEDDD